MKGSNVPKTALEQNKSFVMEALDTLFNNRD
jgi:predicted SnoaL-like aldol condensation-catalyzing enzyme